MFGATGVLSSLPLEFRQVVHGERWPQVKTPTYHLSLGTAEEHSYSRAVSAAGHSSHVSTVLNFKPLARVFTSKSFVQHVTDGIIKQSIINRVLSVVSIVMCAAILATTLKRLSWYNKG